MWNCIVQVNIVAKICIGREATSLSSSKDFHHNMNICTVNKAIAILASSTAFCV